MSSTSGEVSLIWEDEEPGSPQWWLARAHESVDEKRDFFIAEDNMAGYLLGVVRRPPASRYKVIAAVPLLNTAARPDAISGVKTAVARWLMSGPRENIWRWRFARWSKLIWTHIPIAAAGFSVGAVLGFLVAFIAVSSGLVGWPMIIAGITIGAMAGPVLKFFVDRRPKHSAAGPWTRFTIITLAAASGAALAASGVFTQVWGA